jgi:hypothetical protein
MATLIVIQDLLWSGAKPRGGHAMCVLQWLHGLERLGHRAIFLNFVDWDPGEVPGTVEYFGSLMEEWWHTDQCALIRAGSSQSIYGLSGQQIRAEAEAASALLTIAVSGARAASELVENVRPRILVDHDPGYAHLWATLYGPDEIFGEHDFYFTVGTNIGTDRCELPTFGFDWLPIFNPVIQDWWNCELAPPRNTFSTIADWWGVGYLEYQGRMLGPKAEEFKKFLDLPGKVGLGLEIALEIDPDDPDKQRLRDHGWRVVSPGLVQTPTLYRHYIVGSLGEFSCAKGVYVGTSCGWFSDRSACYLASGRPVVVQSTGFESTLPTGLGLFSVNSPEQAAEAIQKITANYEAHSRAARDIAAEYFDSERVIAGMLLKAGI